MEINVTFLIQILVFIIYVYLCKKYIWPYVNNIIEKRKNDILKEQIKIKNIKNNILYLKNKIKKLKYKNKKKILNIILNVRKKSKKIINKAKKKAFYEYKKIIYENKINLYNEKKELYNNFYKNISKILNLILIKITKNTFNEKLNNEYINKILKKFKINAK